MRMIFIARHRRVAGLLAVREAATGSTGREICCATPNKLTRAFRFLRLRKVKARLCKDHHAVEGPARRNDALKVRERVVLGSSRKLIARLSIAM